MAPAPAILSALVLWASSMAAAAMTVGRTPSAARRLEVLVQRAARHGGGGRGGGSAGGRGRGLRLRSASAESSTASAAAARRGAWPKPAEFFTEDAEWLNGMPDVHNVSGSSCHPKCVWDCGQRACNSNCKPACQAPKCVTTCRKPKLSQCRRKCQDPHCAVVCPNATCAHGACPGCTTVCGEAKCTLDCGQGQLCTSRCADPVCAWQCQPDPECVAPQCSLRCDGPKVCGAAHAGAEGTPEQPNGTDSHTEVAWRGLASVPSAVAAGGPLSLEAPLQMVAPLAPAGALSPEQAGMATQGAGAAAGGAFRSPTLMVSASQPTGAQLPAGALLPGGALHVFELPAPAPSPPTLAARVSPVVAWDTAPPPERELQR